MPDIIRTIDQTTISRFDNEPNIWLSAVRDNNQPQLAPFWFIFLDNNFYINIDANYLTGKSLQKNKHVSLALENATMGSVVICHGIATFLPTPWPDNVAQKYQQKYNIALANDSLVKITPQKWLRW